MDLRDHGRGGPVVPARSVPLATQVVDDDPRTGSREEQRFLAPDAAAGPGDDRHLACQDRLGHGAYPSRNRTFGSHCGHG